MTAATPARGFNWWILAVGLGFTALLGTLLAVGFWLDPRELPVGILQKPAPDFRLTDLDGKEWHLADLRGKVVVLNFWSTWCRPCKAEHPVLLDAAQSHPEVVFLGVIYQDKPEAAQRMLRRDGAAYPHLVDPGARVAIDYGVTGVPESFFITRDGVVADKAAYAVTKRSIEYYIAKAKGEVQ